MWVPGQICLNEGAAQSQAACIPGGPRSEKINEVTKTQCVDAVEHGVVVVGIACR